MGERHAQRATGHGSCRTGEVPTFHEGGEFSGKGRFPAKAVVPAEVATRGKGCIRPEAAHARAAEGEVHVLHAGRLPLADDSGHVESPPANWNGRERTRIRAEVLRW